MLYHTTSSLTTRSCSSAWTALMLHRPSTDSHTSPLQFTCGSCRTSCSSTPTSRRLSSLALLLSCQHHYTVDVARSTLPVSPQLKSLGVTGMNIDSNWFDCHARNVAKACNFHTRALHHVCSLLTDDVAQTVACSIVDSRLDYCNTLLCSARRQHSTNYSTPITTWPESSATAGSHRHQAAALVAPLASCEEVSHSVVSQRPGTDPHTNSGSSFIRHSAAGCSPDTDRTRSVHFLRCSPIHLELFTC